MVIESVSQRLRALEAKVQTCRGCGGAGDGYGICVVKVQTAEELESLQRRCPVCGRSRLIKVLRGVSVDDI